MTKAGTAFVPHNWYIAQQSPTFLASGTGFMEDSFSKDGVGWEGMVQAVMRVMGSGRGSFAHLPAAHLLLCCPGVGDTWNSTY